VSVVLVVIFLVTLASAVMAEKGSGTDRPERAKGPKFPDLYKIPNPNGIGPVNAIVHVYGIVPWPVLMRMFLMVIGPPPPPPTEPIPTI